MNLHGTLFIIPSDDFTLISHEHRQVFLLMFVSLFLVVSCVLFVRLMSVPCACPGFLCANSRLGGGTLCFLILKAVAEKNPVDQFLSPRFPGADEDVFVRVMQNTRSRITSSWDRTLEI